MHTLAAHQPESQHDVDRRVVQACFELCEVVWRQVVDAFTRPSEPEQIDFEDGSTVTLGSHDLALAWLNGLECPLPISTVAQVAGVTPDDLRRRVVTQFIRLEICGKRLSIKDDKIRLVESKKRRLFDLIKLSPENNPTHSLIRNRAELAQLD